MLCKVKFDRWKMEFYEENRLALAAFLQAEGLDIPWSDDPEDAKKRIYDEGFFKKEHVFDVQKLIRLSVPFDFTGHVILADETLGGHLVSVLSRVEKRLLTPGERHPEPTKVEVKVQADGDGWLHRVNTVDVIEDCCTDVLRDKLNAGWRIIAVCPQSRNRRPDYVLGLETI